MCVFSSKILILVYFPHNGIKRTHSIDWQVYANFMYIRNVLFQSHIAASDLVGSLSISTWNCTHRFKDDVSWTKKNFSMKFYRKLLQSSSTKLLIKHRFSIVKNVKNKFIDGFSWNIFEIIKKFRKIYTGWMWSSDDCNDFVAILNQPL